MAVWKDFICGSLTKIHENNPGRPWHNRKPTANLKSNNFDLIKTPCYGAPQTSEFLHSASKGLNQGNHTGIGFNDGHGTLNSIALQLPGKQTETLLKLTHGRI
jgi:hypothetical protein